MHRKQKPKNRIIIVFTIPGCEWRAVSFLKQSKYRTPGRVKFFDPSTLQLQSMKLKKKKTQKIITIMQGCNKTFPSPGVKKYSSYKDT